MTIKTTLQRYPSMAWLSTWHQRFVVLVETDDTHHRDAWAKANLPQLTSLLEDQAFLKSLATAYGKLLAKVGEANAQVAVQEFLLAACWICSPAWHAALQKKRLGKPIRADTKKRLQSLTLATRKLAKQIQDLAPFIPGADSVPYLESRLQEGNPDGYIFKRRRNAIPTTSQRQVRRLDELLQTFASDIEEEAAMLGISIAGRRQKGGAQAKLHIAMDTLTTLSAAISAQTPKCPNFALVNQVLTVLMYPKDGFDPSTIRKRFSAGNKRKTPT